MKLPKPLAWVVFASILGLLVGCERSRESPAADSSRVDQPGGVSVQAPKHLADDRDPALEAALAHAARAREERLHNPLPDEPPLPNFNSGPGLPRPIGWNFYEKDARYPGYLLCSYDVSENHYDQSNESEWLRSALIQIRAHGQDAFPSIRWIAIAIVNAAEHKGASTFEQSFKAGAIFTATEAFDMEGDLRKIVSHAELDRHPFKYNPEGEPQLRWLVVERHLATYPKRPNEAKQH